MNEIKVIQSDPGKEIIVRVVHSRFDEDAWIGLFKAGSGDNEHGDRWKWMRDVDVSHITLLHKEQVSGVLDCSRMVATTNFFSRFSLLILIHRSIRRMQSQTRDQRLPHL